MPKRVVPPQVAAIIETPVAPPPPSPIVQKLRTDWHWAAISQFLWTFSDAFGLVDWDIENLENDLDGDETRLLPDLLAKLLYALTYNRQINQNNVFDHLHKQYLKRDPESSPFGTLEEPVEWATLGLSRKVQVIWELCEWQLEDPAKFRALLPSEDEATSWRIDPVGWDKAGNTYFLFDDNRLWVQRQPPAPPRPPKKSSLKAKKALKKSRSSNAFTSQSKPKSHRKREPADLPPIPPPKPRDEEPVSGRRRRTQVQFFGNVTPTVQALKRGGPKETPPSSRGTRSSHRLNGDAVDASPVSAQAKASASTPTRASSRGTPGNKETPLPRGTRVSRRLRDVDDEWQQIPDEWLQNGDTSGSRKKGGNAKNKGKGKQREQDEESELSDLTDEEEHQARLEASKANESSPVPGAGEASKLQVNGVDSEQLTPLPGSETSGRLQDGEAEDAKDEDVDMDVDQKPGNEENAETTEEAKVEDADKTMGDETQHPQENEETKPDEEAKVEPEAKEDVEEQESETDKVKLAVKEANNLPEGFVEWEAVCVTLYDWRTFPDQFKKSKDPDEKALYEMLAEQIAPTIIEALVAKEQERIKQEAINNRKRSSRILARDLEREEQAKREKAQREMEERMDRQRQEEERIAREEAEILAREKAREERLREREERAQAREEAALARRAAIEEAKEQADKERESRKRRRELGLDDVEGSSREGSRAVTPNSKALASGANGQAKSGDDRWELYCEVCRKHGWNIDEDDDLVCCDDCGRWQHVDCHNRLDAAEGRPLRNWDQVDFQCKDCRRRAARKRQRMEEGGPLSSLNAAFGSGPPGQSSHTHFDQRPGPVQPAPPPQLKPGQYYLPYPPDGRAIPPAGYAMYYPTPNGPAASPPQRMVPYQSTSPHGPSPPIPVGPHQNGHGHPHGQKGSPSISPHIQGPGHHVNQPPSQSLSPQDPRYRPYLPSPSPQALPPPAASPHGHQQAWPQGVPHPQTARPYPGHPVHPAHAHPPHAGQQPHQLPQQGPQYGYPHPHAPSPGHPHAHPHSHPHPHAHPQQRSPQAHSPLAQRPMQTGSVPHGQGHPFAPQRQQQNHQPSPHGHPQPQAPPQAHPQGQYRLPPGPQSAPGQGPYPQQSPPRPLPSHQQAQHGQPTAPHKPPVGHGPHGPNGQATAQGSPPGWRPPSVYGMPPRGEDVPPGQGLVQGRAPQPAHAQHPHPHPNPSQQQQQHHNQQSQPPKQQEHRPQQALQQKPSPPKQQQVLPPGPTAPAAAATGATAGPVPSGPSLKQNEASQATPTPVAAAAPQAAAPPSTVGSTGPAPSPSTQVVDMQTSVPSAPPVAAAPKANGTPGPAAPAQVGDVSAKPDELRSASPNKPLGTVPHVAAPTAAPVDQPRTEQAQPDGSA